MKVLKHGAMYVFLVIASIVSIFPIYYALCLASGGNVEINISVRHRYFVFECMEFVSMATYYHDT